MRTHTDKKTRTAGSGAAVRWDLYWLICSCMCLHVLICPYMSVCVLIRPYMSLYVPLYVLIRPYMSPYMSLYVLTDKMSGEGGKGGNGHRRKAPPTTRGRRCREGAAGGRGRGAWRQLQPCTATYYRRLSSGVV